MIIANHARCKSRAPNTPAWPAVLSDARLPLVITNSVAKAAQLCAQGQPAIAVLGVTEEQLTAWLRARGAKVHTKRSAN